MYRLKQDFPDVFVEINGGITTIDDIKTHLTKVDGVMIGREAYQSLYSSRNHAAVGRPVPNRADIFYQLLDFWQSVTRVAPLTTIMRHYLGLFQGLTGSRKWRQALSGQNPLGRASS